MRKLILMVLMAVATTATAQQLDLKVLDKIASKAKKTTEMGLDAATLKSTTDLLNTKKGDEAAAKKSTEDMKGFFLRSYEFEKGDFKFDDLKPITDQLKAPNWTRFLRNKEDREQTEIWMHLTDGKPDGMLLISMEDEELTVINAIGYSNVADFAKLKDLGAPTAKKD